MSSPMRVWNEWMAFSFQAARLGWEAQGVMALRFMRLAKGGPLAQTETGRMVTEKVAALAEARTAAATVAIAGGTHQDAAKKVLRVYKKRVGNNKRRLTKRR